MMFIYLFFYCSIIHDKRISKRILQMNYFKCMKNKSIPWLKGNIIPPREWFLNKEKPEFMWILKAINWRECFITVSRYKCIKCTICQEKVPCRSHLNRIKALFKNWKLPDYLSIILPEVKKKKKKLLRLICRHKTMHSLSVSNKPGVNE